MAENNNLVGAMHAGYPWVVALSQGDQEDCARDTLEALRVSAFLGHVHDVRATLTSWHETAQAIVDGVGDIPVEWLDVPEFVERP